MKKITEKTVDFTNSSAGMVLLIICFLYVALAGEMPVPEKSLNNYTIQPTSDICDPVKNFCSAGEIDLKDLQIVSVKSKKNDNKICCQIEGNQKLSMQNTKTEETSQ